MSGERVNSMVTNGHKKTMFTTLLYALKRLCVAFLKGLYFGGGIMIIPVTSLHGHCCTTVLYWTTDICMYCLKYGMEIFAAQIIFATICCAIV